MAANAPCLSARQQSNESKLALVIYDVKVSLTFEIQAVLFVLLAHDQTGTTFGRTGALGSPLLWSF